MSFKFPFLYTCMFSKFAIFVELSGFNLLD